MHKPLSSVPGVSVRIHATRKSYLTETCHNSSYSAASPSNNDGILSVFAGNQYLSPVRGRESSIQQSHHIFMEALPSALGPPPPFVICRNDPYCCNLGRAYVFFCCSISLLISLDPLCNSFLCRRADTHLLFAARFNIACTNSGLNDQRAAERTPKPKSRWHYRSAEPLDRCAVSPLH